MDDQNPFLLCMAIGDAYGMKYEFVPHKLTADKSDLFYGSHPKFTDYPQGHYTDDTQMSLAITELLLKRGASPSTITATDLIEAWLATFKRDPHLGYSHRMFKVMSESKDAAVFINSIDPTQGVTGGAAMRAGPIGLLPDVEDVKSLTRLQAQITHNTQTGTNSALAVALTVHFLHHGGKREKLADFLDAHIGDNWRSAENGSSSDPHNGLRIVLQAITAFQDASTLSEVLLTAVNQDQISDTDTVCALAMLMASRCSEIRGDLPANLYGELENGAFGADYLRKIDNEAAASFPASTGYKDYGVTILPKKKPLHP